MTEHVQAVFHSRSAKLLLVAVAAVIALAMILLLFAPRADGLVATESITNPSGPLTKITLGEDLSCQANYLGDAEAQFFPPNAYPGDCGTFLMVDPPLAPGVFYAPDINNHGGTAAASYLGPFTVYTYDSQSLVTGSGSVSSPFKVTTTVHAGAKTLIVQDDTYVIGQESFMTTITITNEDSGVHNYRLWRAVDCFLGDKDAGYGWADPPGNFARVACTEYPNNQPAGRYQMFIPVTPGTSYMEGEFSEVWKHVSTHTAFPNTVHEYGKPPCTKPPAPPPNPPCRIEDNGMGISWDLQLQPNESKTFVSILQMSPGAPPNQPPTASIVVTQPPPTCQDSRIFFSGVFNDPDGSIFSVHWEFGDGSTYDDAAAQHTYEFEGTYPVTVTVTDNQMATAVATATVTAVDDTNCCPSMNPLGDREATEGQYIRFYPKAQDPEADPLVFSLTPALPSGATFDAASGYFIWRTLEGDAGAYSLVIKVTDNKDHSAEPAPCADTQPVTLKVNPKMPGTPTIDSDLDGIDDSGDNCPGIPNPSQADADRDGIGDACQGAAAATIPTPPAPIGKPSPIDRDGDSFADDLDNCPGIANSDQADFDLDRIGNVCDADLDGDGIAQSAPAGSKLDNCPLVPNQDQKDDGDVGKGNACRTDPLQSGSETDAADPGVVAGDSYGSPPNRSQIVFYSVVAAVAVILAVGTIVWGVRRRQ